MPTTRSYEAAAAEYAASVRAFFAPSGTARVTERSSPSAAPAPAVAERAEQLARSSNRLTDAARTKLSAADPEARAEASTQLLAKALIDVEVSAILLEAAQDEAAGADTARVDRGERGVAALGRSSMDQQLRVILGEDVAARDRRERGVARLHDLPTARAELCATASDALFLIKQRAAKAGQAALAGLVGLGVGELAQAAAVVGVDIAAALGQAEKVTRLYNLVREFVAKAYESLLALLGPPLVQTASKQVLGWIDEVRNGSQFARIVDIIYQTAETEAAVQQMVRGSAVSLERYSAAIERVSALSDTYGRQMGLIDRMSEGLTVLAGVAAAVLPSARLLAAACSILLCAYVVLAGADLVDAQRLKLLDRTPGVRRTVADSLGLT